MANNAGWHTSVSASRELPACRSNSSSRFHSTRASIRAETRANASRNTGSCARRSRAIPSHWEPCPLNTKASLRGPRAKCSAEPVPSPAWCRRSFCAHSARELPVTAIRKGRCARRQLAEYAISRQVTSEASCSSRSAHALIAERRAVAEFAEIGSSQRLSPSARRSAACHEAFGAVGHSANTACALVPLMPKELTPAIKRSLASGQGPLHD